MALMDLRCPVPSEGAHRLAWLIGTADDPAAKICDLEDRIGINKVERLLSGILTPSEAMGASIWLASCGKIETRMFYRPTALRWWEAPPGFEPRRPVMMAA
jgi:hypothetical protein